MTQLGTKRNLAIVWNVDASDVRATWAMFSLDGPKPESVPKRLLDESPESDPRDRKSTYLPRFCINGASMTFNARDENKESP
eukprot:CAMPEP_0198146170 /NCGR_PEP_ID=MMETSP1443-20131203/27886_1 /TAXON_ID=186043 /ORGANISM="Entomoneis sp., Strain CCMP2396" /LENGTH=81 /DNA_ID=CAMNT_0043810031 /DNA_START=413 /DNA_END=657 /DNA_ORIENTATION=+